MFADIMFIAGLLGVISLGTLYEFKLNMVAGAFWLLLSPTLARELPFAGRVGAGIGLGHLAYFVYHMKYGFALDEPEVEVTCQI